MYVLTSTPIHTHDTRNLFIIQEDITPLQFVFGEIVWLACGKLKINRCETSALSTHNINKTKIYITRLLLHRACIGECIYVCCM